MLNFLVKSSSIPLIAAKPSSIIYNIGSNVTLCCSVILSTSTSSVATNVNIQWLNSSNHTLHSYTGLNDYTEHTINYTISYMKLSNAGQYTCLYYINTLVDYPYILHSANKTIYTNITAASK